MSSVYGGEKTPQELHDHLSQLDSEYTLEACTEFALARANISFKRNIRILLGNTFLSGTENSDCPFDSRKDNQSHSARCTFNFVLVMGPHLWALEFREATSS